MRPSMKIKLFFFLKGDAPEGRRAGLLVLCGLSRPSIGGVLAHLARSVGGGVWRRLTVNVFLGGEIAGKRNQK